MVVRAHHKIRPLKDHHILQISKNISTKLVVFRGLLVSVDEEFKRLNIDFEKFPA